MLRLFVLVFSLNILLGSCANKSAGNGQDAATSDSPSNVVDTIGISSNNLVNSKPEITTTTSTEISCSNNKRAYEFGREMYTWVLLRGDPLSLSGAIAEYSESLGIAPPFDSNDACVRKGFDDASKGLDSPYNKDERSWTTF
jgi:hypothetical protein